MKYGKNFSVIVVLLVLLLVFILPSIAALSLSGHQMNPIIYQPGLNMTNHYTVSGTNQPVTVDISPGPFNHLKVTEVVNNEFDLIIDFPKEELIPTGSYSFTLSARETPDAAGGSISSRVTISRVFTVEVYSYGKEIHVSLNAPNINEGSNASFQLSVASMGYSNIDAVQGEIKVYNPKKEEVGRIVTEKRPLEALETTNYALSLDSSSFPTSEYLAKAVVSYDGRQKTANTTFLIGNMELVVKNYTSVLEQGFAEFSVTVQNNWGNKLRNVYAKLFINEQELLHTPSINLEPWQEGMLKGIVKVDLEPGIYDGTLQLFFEGESKEVPVNVKVVVLEVAADLEIGEEGEQEMLKVKRIKLILLASYILIIIIILGIILSIYLGRRKRKMKGSKKDEL